MPDLLESYGYDAAWQTIFAAQARSQGVPGRIVGERRGEYDVVTSTGRVVGYPAPMIRKAMLSGGLKPAVGDFVVISCESATRWRIQSILSRRTVIARREAGRVVREQVLAANVDTALIVCAFGGEMNARRIERLVAIVATGGARPVIVANKADLVPPQEAATSLAEIQPPEVERLCLSLQTGSGLAQLRPYLKPGKTIALIGSSGVGKTSLLNSLLQSTAFATGGVTDDSKGRHTTRSRHLELAPDGLLVVDTPGIREVGVWRAEAGIDDTFPEVVRFASLCRFNDCHHINEPECAVRAAVQAGEIARPRMEAWRRLIDEAAGKAAARMPRRGHHL